jgi:hypothetical protein
MTSAVMGFVLLLAACSLMSQGILADVAASESCPATFAEALRAGMWDCAKQISEVAMAAGGSGGQDLRNLFDLESRLISKELADLKMHLERNIVLADINPAYQWAQSTDELFLSVKFAHKLDTPGTLNVEAKNVTLLEDRLELFATDGRKNFRLAMNFLKDVVPEESSWSMASVGRMSFQIKKKQPVGTPSKWSRLLKDRKRVPNQHFWLAMHEKYAKELDKVREEGDDGEDETEKPKVAKKPAAKAEKAIPTEKTVAATDVDGNAAPVRHPALTARLSELQVRHAEEVKRLEGEAKAKKKEIDTDCRTRKQAVSRERDEAIRLLNETLAQDMLDVEGNFTAVMNEVGEAEITATAA